MNDEQKQIHALRYQLYQLTEAADALTARMDAGEHSHLQERLKGASESASQFLRESPND